MQGVCPNCGFPVTGVKVRVDVKIPQSINSLKLRESDV